MLVGVAQSVRAEQTGEQKEGGLAPPRGLSGAIGLCRRWPWLSGPLTAPLALRGLQLMDDRRWGFRPPRLPDRPLFLRLSLRVVVSVPGAFRFSGGHWLVQVLGTE